MPKGQLGWGRACIAALSVFVTSAQAGAQATSATSRARACDRVGTTVISFGQTGGNIRPGGIRIGVDGTVTRTDDSVSGSPAALSRDAVRGLARLAWTSEFTALPPAPTRPTRNPDAAREFIELRSPCGSKHVEYAAGEGAPIFRELYALLTALTSVAPAARR
jgi:hypothetical protein